MKHNKPSATAALVLQALVLAAKSPRLGKLVSPEAEHWARHLARTVVGSSHWARVFVDSPLLCRSIESVASWINVGFLPHIVARKALISKLADEAFVQGFTQLLVIGAGYDSLALRSARAHAGLRSLEIDHPATQRMKRRALADVELPANLRLVAADLSTTTLAEALAKRDDFDPERPTLVVMEGLLMYLPEEVVRGLFGQIKSLLKGHGRLRVVFTFLHRWPDGDIHFRGGSFLLKAWLRLKGEPFRWGLDKRQLSSFLDAVGFDVKKIYGAEDFAEIFFANETSPRFAEGEHVAVADGT